MPSIEETSLPRPIPEGRSRLAVFRSYLNPHYCSVQSSGITNQFYLTDKLRRGYILRLAKTGGWICEPLNHRDQYAADQLLDVALGKRWREID